MALRLILVGVVASLALDLPGGDVRPVATRAIRSILVAEPTRPAPAASTPSALVAGEPVPAVANPPIARELTIAPSTTVTAIRPPATLEASLPSAPAIAEAAPAPAAIAPSPLPVELALVPTVEVASAPAPAPATMPMPPVLEVASAPIAPISDAVPAIAPIPTVVAVDPMTTPPTIAPEMSPEAAPAPAPAVVEVETAAPTDPDAAFRKIVARMAFEFAADVPAATPATEPKPLLARVETPADVAPPAAVAPAPAAEEVVVADPELALYPGVAYALDPEADGVAAKEATARAEPAAAPAAPAEPSRAERLSQAVKLTGEAMNAWAGLLSQRTASSAIQR